ncbi:MAG: hypothetical protein FWC08_13885, partial [Defluviitaleaceae bacterium]|nr:hypothetical protein [Defluviitaleaceae bacterium]
MGFALFDTPIRIEMECGPNWSFASTTIVCSYFGFDIETIKENNKERFQKFMELIDAIEISAGVEKNTIRVYNSIFGDLLACIALQWIKASGGGMLYTGRQENEPRKRRGQTKMTNY